MSSPFSRSLPSHPDIEQQRKQAKDLLRSFIAGEPESVARVRAVLPDKLRISLTDAQFVIAREYGFVNWAALKQHIESREKSLLSPEERIRAAFARRDARAVRQLLELEPALRERINEPVFPFNSPAIVSFANDVAMVEALLDNGADPNRRSNWWAGGFHALHHATGVAADRLIEAGAIPDACAAAHLGRVDMLEQMLSDDPARVHERGGDGQTPLHFATSRAVIDLLLDAGADIDARDVDHRSTPAEWMLECRKDAGRYHLARYLVDRGASADIFMAAALGLTQRVRTMIQERPELLEARTGRGEYAEQPPSSYHIYFWTIGDARSPLDVAAQFGHEDTLAAIMEHASPVQRLRAVCWNGDEQKARAIVREHPELIASMTEDDHRTITDAAWNGNARAVALMLELGFDPRAPGHDSGTALHCAAWEGSLDTVAALLRHPDASELVAIRDAHYGATPLGWCCHGSVHGNTSHDHAGVARLLLAAGAQPGPDTGEASPEIAEILAAHRKR